MLAPNLHQWHDMNNACVSGASNLAIDCFCKEGGSISSVSVWRGLNAAAENFDQLIQKLITCVDSNTDADTKEVIIIPMNSVISLGAGHDLWGRVGPGDIGFLPLWPSYCNRGFYLSLFAQVSTSFTYQILRCSFLPLPPWLPLKRLLFYSFIQLWC